MNLFLIRIFWFGPVSIPLIILIATCIFWGATKLNLNFKPPFHIVLGVTLAVLISIFMATVVLSLILNMLSGGYSEKNIDGGNTVLFFGYALSNVIYFLISTLIYGKLIENPDTGPIGFKNSLYVNLSAFAFLILLNIVYVTIMRPVIIGLTTL